MMGPRSDRIVDGWLLWADRDVVGVDRLCWPVSPRRCVQPTRTTPVTRDDRRPDDAPLCDQERWSRRTTGRTPDVGQPWLEADQQRGSPTGRDDSLRSPSSTHRKLAEQAGWVETPENWSYRRLRPR